MIVPSIDIVAGQAVQLVGGEEEVVEAGDPRPLMQRFSRMGEVAVVDIDAARGEGDNGEMIAALCAMGRVRVGGGVRNLDKARWWLDAGAEKVVIGTAARAGFLSELPPERVVVALDARRGEVVTHGWRTSTGFGLLESITELRGSCGGFLVTFVEREGRLAGTDMDMARRVVEAAGKASVTIAGGVTTPEEVAALDAIGADAQVGMALYTGAMELVDAFAAPLRSDRGDGLWATVVTDRSGKALGLAWSDRESLAEVIDTGRGVYHSRSRGLWVKGETSGNTQDVVAVDIDCDRDAIRVTVDQQGPGFCHRGTQSCWGEDRGLTRLGRRLDEIVATRPEGSNTALLASDAELLGAKLVEEAGELAAAHDAREVTEEAADLLYFLLTRLAVAGVGLEQVEAVLDAREKRITRRPMQTRGSR